MPTISIKAIPSISFRYARCSRCPLKNFGALDAMSRSSLLSRSSNPIAVGEFGTSSAGKSPTFQTVASTTPMRSYHLLHTNLRVISNAITASLLITAKNAVFLFVGSLRSTSNAPYVAWVFTFLALKYLKKSLELHRINTSSIGQTSLISYFITFVNPAYSCLELIGFLPHKSAKINKNFS